MDNEHEMRDNGGFYIKFENATSSSKKARLLNNLCGQPHVYFLTLNDETILFLGLKKRKRESRTGEIIVLSLMARFGFKLSLAPIYIFQKKLMGYGYQGASNKKGRRQKRLKL